MTKSEFDKSLKDLNLNKKEFARIAKQNYGTVNNWGTKRGENSILPIPNWVEPFLEHYTKSIKFDYIAKNICKDIISLENKAN